MNDRDRQEELTEDNAVLAAADQRAQRLQETLKSRRYWRKIAALQFMTALLFATAYAVIAKVPGRRLPRVFAVPAAFGLATLLHHLVVRRTERRVVPVPSAVARRRIP